MSDMQGGTGSRSHRLLQRCMLPEAGRTRRSPGHTAGAGDAVPASSNRLVFEGVPRLGQPRPHSGAAEVVGMRNEIELQEAYVRLKALRSEERRVGKECRARRTRDSYIENNNTR